MTNVLYYPYQIKERDIKELVDDIIVLGDFFTYSQQSEFKPYLYDYNGTRYGPIEQTEETEIFDGITIRDIKDNKNKTAIVRYHKGDFSINIDISTCPTQRSLLYFIFQKWYNYKEIMEFRRFSVNVTPNKKQRI